MIKKPATSTDCFSTKSPTASAPTTILPKVKRYLVPALLQHKQYRLRDTVDLASKATAYTKGRLRITTREMAIAVLLSRDRYTS